MSNLFPSSLRCPSSPPSGPPFSLLDEIERLRANLLPSARSRTREATEETREEMIPYIQNRWEILLIRECLLCSERFKPGESAPLVSK